jgi:FMN phosphatase YigB (HAD superfamily)
MIKNKVILTDCDGVLLDWEYHFHRWMEKKGFVKNDVVSYKIGEMYNMSGLEAKNIIKHFNESAQIAFLSPYKDAVKYVRKLHEEHGYIFHCISSLSKDPAAQELRKQNLRKVFGETVFEEFILLGCGHDKDDALKPYENSECYWIEDKFENAELGIDMGLTSLLMSHDHNSGRNTRAKVVNNWKAIYNEILGYSD